MSRNVLIHDVRRCEDDVLLLRHYILVDAGDFCWQFAPGADLDPGDCYEVWYQHVPPRPPKPRVGLMRFGR